jgi:hypothetical protein
VKHKLLRLLIILILSSGIAFALDPAVYDFGMQAGEDFVLQLTLKDSSNTVINLTGNTYKSQFRSAPAPSGTVYATYSTVVVDAAAGRLDIRLSKAQTLANDTRQGVWDLQQTSSGGQITYLMKGNTRVHSTVTR